MSRCINNNKKKKNLQAKLDCFRELKADEIEKMK